jgi:hypothetical protein
MMRSGNRLVSALGQTPSADIDQLLEGAGTKRDFGPDREEEMRSQSGEG